jgi:hypothetical protein
VTLCSNNGSWFVAQANLGSGVVQPVSAAFLGFPELHQSGQGAVISGKDRCDLLFATVWASSGGNQLWLQLVAADLVSGEGVFALNITSGFGRVAYY